VKSTQNEQSRPGGLFTFFFSDIEKSTLLWERHGERMRPVLARHDALLRAVVEEAGGRVVKTTGDGLLAVFESAADALVAALGAQRRLDSEAWAEIAPDIVRVRIGLHSGEAQQRAGDYYGTAVNRAARIMDLGHGGQVLLSAVAASSLHGNLPLQTSLRDMGKHPLRGLSGDEQIFQLVAAGLGDEFPPLRSGKTLSGNLPAHVSSFVGRTREMAEVRAALPQTRLLTLTGPGGTGKTRLSMQVAADVQHAYDHGAWLVELAPIMDPELVETTVAGVFGLSGQTTEHTREILLDYLREKELLLILDNCEHLIDACAQLASDLIAGCPRLTIVASSREGLGVYGEMTYHLPTMALPPTNDSTAESAAHSEAVQLFVERAAAVRKGFRLNDVNATVVIQIVRRLDGIPLAIELAAARLQFFTVEQIANRLDDRFRLLTGGSRTALPRQQTLRAMIDWSYDLLTDDERELMRLLSVFAGGWTFSAAESAAGPLDAYMLLPQLVAKSLVMHDAGQAPDLLPDEGVALEPRYLYLETVRQYARDRLVEAGELEEARDHHFDYYEELAQGVIAGSVGITFSSIGREHDNVRSAVEWGIERYPDRVLSFIWNIALFLADRFPGTEIIDWTKSALQKLEEQPAEDYESARLNEEARYKGLLALGLLNMVLGQLHEANRLAAEVTEALRQPGTDPQLLAMALFVRAQTGFFLQDPAMIDLADESVSIMHDLEDTYANRSMLAMALAIFAVIEQHDGDPKKAEGYYHEVLALRDNAQDQFLSWAEFALFMMMMRAGIEPEAMEVQYQRTTSTLQRSGSRRTAAMVQSDWAHKLRHEGRQEEAAAIYRPMLGEWRELGHRAAMANILENMAFIKRAEGRPRRTVTLLGAAERIREEIGQEMLEPERVEYERELAKLREVLPAQELELQWQRGRMLSTDDIIALATAEGVGNG
jgi:predicted ATPase/class 3 adenylate cyclase